MDLKKRDPRAPYKVRKIDSQALARALEKTFDATLKELAHEFNCQLSAIHKRLKKLGITRSMLAIADSDTHWKCSILIAMMA